MFRSYKFKLRHILTKVNHLNKANSTELDVTLTQHNLLAKLIWKHGKNQFLSKRLLQTMFVVNYEQKIPKILLLQPNFNDYAVHTGHFFCRTE
jgi:hypothetical protein